PTPLRSGHAEIVVQELLIQAQLVDEIDLVQECCVGVVCGRIEGVEEPPAISPPDLAVSAGRVLAELEEQLVRGVDRHRDAAALGEADEIPIDVAAFPHAAPDIALGDDAVSDAPIVGRSLELPRQIPQRLVRMEAQDDTYPLFHP